MALDRREARLHLMNHNKTEQEEEEERKWTKVIVWEKEIPSPNKILVNEVSIIDVKVL